MATRRPAVKALPPNAAGETLHCVMGLCVRYKKSTTWHCHKSVFHIFFFKMEKLWAAAKEENQPGLLRDKTHLYFVMLFYRDSN